MDPAPADGLVDAGSGAPPTLQVEHLTVWYAGEDAPALREVDLSLAPGERLLLLGASGAGKSTLALCLNGIIPRAVGGRVEGRVLLDGQPIDELPPGEPTRRVGVLFQDPEAQFCMLRVEDEVAFGLENLALPPSLMPARIQAALAAVGLPGAAAMRLDRLSGGTKQRVALACLLAMQPDVLVLDEPTANLDPAATRSIFGVVGDLVADRRRGLIVIEHKLDECLDQVGIDRVVVLDPAGGMAAAGPPRLVFEHEADRLERLGVWQPTASRLARRLGHGGFYAIRPHPLTVDEATEAFARAGIGPAVLEAEIARTQPPAPASPAEPAVALAGLSFAYDRRPVLRHVSLEVPEGHLLAIVGPNGAGKTTLGQLAAGLRRPPPGTVRLFGRDVREYTPAELATTVGYVFQNPEHQFVRQTVFEEVAFGLQVLGEAADAIRPRVEDLLADFGLLEHRWANPFSLSQGQKRRLSVATQLITRRRLLVLDEPTFGQDPRTSAALMDRIVALNQQGRTIILVTHDLQLVSDYATLVAVLVDGQVRYTGSPAGLLAQPDLLRAAALTLPAVWAIATNLKQRVSRCTSPLSPN